MERHPRGGSGGSSRPMNSAFTLDPDAQDRLQKARRAAARLPQVDDPLNIELIAAGFDWDELCSLYRQYDRQVIARCLHAVKSKREGEARRYGTPIIIGVGAIKGAIRERWDLPHAARPGFVGWNTPEHLALVASAQAQGTPPAPAAALADAPTSAPAVALAAPASTAHAGASEFSSSGNSRSNTTTTDFGNETGGGGDFEAARQALTTGKGCMWDIGRINAVARHPLAVVLAAIELAKESQIDTKCKDWGRFVERKIVNGTAQKLAEERTQAAERSAAARARAQDADAAKAAQADAAQARIARAVTAAAQLSPAAVLAIVERQAAASGVFAGMLARRFPHVDGPRDAWAVRVAQEPRVAALIADELTAALEARP